MGRKNNKRWSKGPRGAKNNGNNSKRRKVTRFWIEDCTELEPAPGEAAVCDALLWITRVELTDDHHRKRNDSEGIPPTSNKTASEKVPLGKQEGLDKVGAGDDPAVSNPVEDAATHSDEEDVTTPASPSLATKDDLELARVTTNMTIQPWHPDPAVLPKLFVKRAAKARPSKMHYPNHYRKDYVILPNGDCGDGVVNPNKQVPDKYWAQRHRLFQKFDSGIQLDAEGWFSVTPEAIANHIASKTSAILDERAYQSPTRIILDAFGGMGGNTIAYGLRSDVHLVICVDTDLAKLKMAASNCKIYDVPTDKVLLVNADACEVLKHYDQTAETASSTKEVTKEDNSAKQHEADSSQTMDGYVVISDFSHLPEHLDAVFLSPPWGGVDYQEKAGRRHYDLTCVELNEGTTNGQDLFHLSYKACPTVLYFLPRNLNGLSLGQSVVQSGFSGVVELEQQFLNGKMKTITAYFRSTASEVEPATAAILADEGLALRLE